MDILLAAVAAVVLAVVFFVWLDRHDAATYEDVWENIAPPLLQEVEEARATLWDTATLAANHEAVAERAQTERDALERTLDEERAAADEQRESAEARGRLTGRQAVADPLWALEIGRAARQWRDAMGGFGGASAAVPESPSTALVAAMGWDLERLREEVGVPATLETDVPTWLPPATALIGLRLAQEIVAAVVKESDSLEVRLGTLGVLDAESGPALTVHVTCTGCPRPLAEVPAVADLTATAARLDTKVIVDDLGDNTSLVVLHIPIEA